MKNTIILSNFFENQISIRASIRDLFEKLSLDSNELIFDFNEIEFISRSCADEYLKCKMNNPHLRISEINLSSNLQKMFSLVISQYKKEFGIICN